MLVNLVTNSPKYVDKNNTALRINPFPSCFLNAVALIAWSSGSVYACGVMGRMIESR
jgi:hypothetical protein